MGCDIDPHFLCFLRRVFPFLFLFCFFLRRVFFKEILLADYLSMIKMVLYLPHRAKYGFLSVQVLPEMGFGHCACCSGRTSLEDASRPYCLAALLLHSGGHTAMKSWGIYSKGKTNPENNCPGTLRQPVNNSKITQEEE